MSPEPCRSVNIHLWFGICPTGITVNAHIDIVNFLAAWSKQIEWHCHILAPHANDDDDEDVDDRKNKVNFAAIQLHAYRKVLFEVIMFA